jgi:transposase
MCGKKLPQLIQEALASFPHKQPLRLMFQDEARFGRISDCCYCWCKKPLRPVVKAMLSHQYVYAYAAVSPQDGKLDSLVLPEVNGQWMQEFLTEVASRYPQENIVMVLDGAGWHKSKSFAMPANLRLLFLPPYSPELNPQEHIWDELREKCFHNKTFDSLDLLEDHLVESLRVLEMQADTVKGIVHWDWIINAISNGN